jgi:phosphatidylinositol-3-phosphatase
MTYIKQNTGSRHSIITAALVVLSLALAISGQAVFAQTIPVPAHVVIVMEENHSYAEIVGSAQAPYINNLAALGASFTNSRAIGHPSEPNYLAIFSGSTQGVTDDSCPHTFSVPNLASKLIAAGKTFASYSEGLPTTGSTVCTAGNYARKHVPWTNFSNVPSSTNLPFTKFPTNFARLPTVSFVVPNLVHDMHDGTIQQGDTWLKNHLAAYAAWAQNNNSLLIVTWDEDDGSQSNQIPTIFIGPRVLAGNYNERITHYRVLRTVEDMYGLPHTAHTISVKPITDVWQ